MGRSTRSASPRALHARERLAELVVSRGKHLKLRSALCLCLGLSAACGDDPSPRPEPANDAGMDARTNSDGQAPIDGAQNDVRRSRIVSVAPSYVVVGDSYRYRVKANTTSSALEMEGAPSNMKARGSMIEWTPTPEQAGSHRMTVRAVAGQAVAEQELTVKVATATLRADGDVDDQGGTIYADSPAAGRMIGAGVSVPARAVTASARITVSELDQAPATPNAAGRAKAVRFGPAGQVFDTPARITLPLPEAENTASARVNVYVYEPAGRWKRVPMVAMDTQNRLVTARAQHFSVYAAIESALDLSLEVSHTKDSSACATGLQARAWLESPLADVELASLNNLPEQLRARVSGDSPSLQNLLEVQGFTGSLRAVQVFELVERHGDSELTREQRALATTLYVTPDGRPIVTHSDALGNVLARRDDYEDPQEALDDIAARLRGQATAVSFEAGAGELGVGARVHLLYFADDASREPVNIDDLGISAVERAPVFEVEATPAVDDGDCDGVVDPYDVTDDRLVASITASPRAVVNLLSGDSVKLSARVANGTPVTESWQIIAGEGATLSADPASAQARVFSARAADRYLVSYRAKLGDKDLEHVFAVDVGEALAENTPPSCRPSRDLDTGRVGDGMALTAITSDAETASSALRIEWGLLDGDSQNPTLVPNAAVRGFGERALFAPLDAGNYTVGCRAFDGQAWGPVGRANLSVVSRNQNRSPGDVTVSPAASVLAVGQSLTLHASAKDPDGDPLSFTWQVTGADVDAPQTRGNESTQRITATGDGAVQVKVWVTDNITPPIWAYARVQVGTSPGTVDADKDGWNAGSGALADCDDANPDVHPGAVDACGDEIDADCDGEARSDDCDDDGYTSERGDCDDANPDVHPQATELCDGVDNDCDEGIDEAFSVGQQCVSGEGACRTTGKVECAADHLSTLCTAMPKPGAPETCDGIDNDCNGVIDNGVCAPEAGVDAGVDGGTDASIDASREDARTETTADATVGGCVAGPEVCDGVDNDCDGVADDIPGYQPCQTGELGACGPGWYSCIRGELICIGQTQGRPEECNAVDDDCNGEIDDARICVCNPTGGENCYDKQDNDCDGATDADDADCKGCTSQVEKCFNGEDDDCDGSIDDADPDCCAPDGREVCDDGKDNDCDFYTDREDSECQQVAAYADSCTNVGYHEIEQWKGATFDGAYNDIATSCGKEMPADLVYRIEIKDPGAYLLQTAGAGSEVLAWSVHQGKCEPNATELRELACNAAPSVDLEPGEYFLVLEGVSGSFEFMLSPIIFRR